MKVTIKKRLTSAEKTSLNLVITKDGKRTIESLGLFIYNFPKSKLEQQENKKTLELAEHLRAEKVIQVQDKRFGIQRQDFSDMNFLEYYAEKMEERRESSGNYGNWNSALKYLKQCFGDRLPMSDVTIETCSKFRLFLETKARTKSNTPLSQNSKYLT